MTKTLHLYNTETRQTEDVPPDNVLRLYTCGPTVYNDPHIGNLRTFAFEDLLKRTLCFFGKKVIHVMNLTDVDDKTIRGALKQNVALDEYTARYKANFFKDLKILNIVPADHYPEATKYIPQMIAHIEKLIEKGFAYVGGDGSIYFALSKFPSYGRLAHLQHQQLQTNVRVHADEYAKDHVADFVLWKKHDPERDGTIFWESPFGPGRPGWHIECSVMAKELLGETIDIHAGGVDLIFPHHENEIAQSEAVTNKPFVRMWVHVDPLIVDGRKMSKSLGNCYILNDLVEKGYNPRAIRFMLLQTHYRICLNFTFQVLEAAHNALSRIDECILRVMEYNAVQRSSKNIGYFEETEEKFKEALADDLNIAEATAVLFDCVRHVNGLIDRNEFSEEDKMASLKLFKAIDTVLGVMEFGREIPQAIYALAQKREEARRTRNFTLADQLRKEVLEKGYLIEDTPQGARIKAV